MEQLRDYFISVAAAAILCACVRQFAGEKDTAGKVVKLVCGLYLAFTVISPVAEIQVTDFALFTAEINADAASAVAAGEEYANDVLADIIKSEAEAYILDKAHALGLDIQVEVSVEGSSQPMPQQARISGSISPYAKKQLEQILTDELGIPEEDQIWINERKR